MCPMLIVQRTINTDHTNLLENSYQRQLKLSEKQIFGPFVYARSTATHRGIDSTVAKLGKLGKLLSYTGSWVCMSPQSLLLQVGEQSIVHGETQQLSTSSKHSEKTSAGRRATKQKGLCRQQLMFVWKEAATLASCTPRHVEGTTQQLHSDIIFKIASELTSIPKAAPVGTGMLTKAAFYPICIFCCVPYLLTSLHITTSTAIRAVDDNQSA